MKGLSHHESHVLALVQKWQPTTAYFLRKALTQRLASDASDSPGSVYPAIERLKKAGLVTSRRGPGGGYMLARGAHEISFVEVIRAIDGPIALVPCASENFYQRCDDCHDEATCAIRKVLMRVRSSAVEILEKTTLADAAGSELAAEALSPA